jgi:hypothetical protein
MKWGGIMQIKESEPDKRLSQRLNLSFEIIANDIDAFAPGAIIPLQIAAIDSNKENSILVEKD